MQESARGRYQIIVNPTAGRGNGERIIPALRANLDKYGVDFELVRTERPFHAADLARQAAEEGFDVVVAAGGDGTANEVINGLMQVKEKGRLKTAMGVIGCGRGNDFAYSAGMPDDVDEACRILAAGQRKRMDVGHVQGGLYPDGRYFGNSLGIGFDAVVGFEAVKMTRLSGAVSYLVAVLKTVFLYYKAPQVEIGYDGQVLSLPALLISIMNGQRQGGLFMMAPESENDDGLLDLCIVHEVSKGRIFTLIPHFFSGSQFGQEEVQFLQTDGVMVRARQGVLPAHLDGETLSKAGRELVIKLLPGQLDLIYGHRERVQNDDAQEKMLPGENDYGDMVAVDDE
jgi:YegS/Rv2252/BmrU family lipid kinase